MPAADGFRLLTANQFRWPQIAIDIKGVYWLYRSGGQMRAGAARQRMQMAWQKVASFSSMPEDGVTGVNVDGITITLYRIGDEVFATHGICTHALAFLSDGWVEDGKIECPLHQGQFDIRTGKALCSPVTEDLRVYPVKRDGDDILISLSDDVAANETAESSQPTDLAAAVAVVLSSEAAEIRPTPVEELTMNFNPTIPVAKRVWPNDDLSEIPDWIYTDQGIYDLEVEKIFHGQTWNYVALEAEVPEPGNFIRSNVGPTPVVVARADDGSVNVFENRCSHRAAEFCRDLRGQTKEFVCPYHQWSYDLKGTLAGIPFRRGVNGKGGMPSDFKSADHGPRRLKVTTHRGVVFASYAEDVEPLADYFGPEILKEFEATFDGRKLKLLGHYRHSLPGNWKLYHENLRDPYHATLLHTFLVTFGLLSPGNRSLMLMDERGRHGYMASSKSDAKNMSSDTKKEMRAYKEGMTLKESRFMDFIEEFDSPWSVIMATIWPNLIIQREMNTLGIRHIVPTGPHEFIMKWTMFGFEDDDEEMTRHRLRQGNLMGPAGFLGLEDNEAIKFVQDGMQRVPNGKHLVKLDPAHPAGSSETVISESAIRAMYKYWRQEMNI
jgi:phenylpropionate dioxygenase-like ring-hydroxylating dioxygenase large terminal subunit